MMDHHIVLDLEANCWPTRAAPDRMETIEIGAVRLIGEPLRMADDFGMFVRPVAEPVLSEFSKELTTIRQSDVDSAPAFPEALRSFLNWVGPDPAMLCSWGDYDRHQLEIDCRRHGLTRPSLLDHHPNLKRLFSERHGRRPCRMRKALRIAALEHEGTHHRGRDDAHNIARLAILLLGAGGVVLPAPSAQS